MLAALSAQVVLRKAGAERVIPIGEVFSGKGDAPFTIAADELATEIPNHRSYLIEVKGFASSDGNEALNRRLSEQRAAAVMRYLSETKSVPLRHFITPHGFGENKPVADNTTREGRNQNRRVEVRLLINRALERSGADQAGTARRIKPKTGEAGGR